MAVSAVLFLTACRNEEWEETATLKTLGYPVAVAWASDDVLATISDFGREVKIWNADATTRHNLGRIAGPYTSNSLSFLNGGRYLLTPCARLDPYDPKRPLAALSVWDAATGKVVTQVYGPEYGSKGPSNHPAFFAASPDGTKVALITHRDDRVILYDTRDWRIERIIPTRPSAEGGDGLAASVAFSPDNRYLAIGRFSKVGIINLDHPDTPPEVIKVYDEMPARLGIYSLAFSPDGGMLATGTGSLPNEVMSLNPDRIRVWRLRDHALVASFKDGLVGIQQLSWSADGRHLAAATGKEVHILTPSEPLSQPSILHFDTHVMSVQFSPSGQRLAVAAGTVSIQRTAR